MASTKTLNEKNLAALGADRLAALLIELADSAGKRRLRLELASTSGGNDVAHEVRKRLATIGKSRSYVEWDKVRPLAADLRAQLHAITTYVAPANPKEGVELLWRFLAIASSIYERCDDSNGTIGAVFENALEAIGPVAVAAKLPPAQLAESVTVALFDNGYAQYDGIVSVMAEALGADGLKSLKAIMEQRAKKPPEPEPDSKKRMIGYGSGGPIYQEDLDLRQHSRTIKSAVEDIADALGDVDGFIATHSAEQRRNPYFAAEIAERLLNAGRVDEALAALAGAEADRRKGGHFPDWDRMNIAALEASGQAQAAQDARWSLFETGLQASYLRDYLKRLPDFDDIEAEERAIAHASAYPQFGAGLYFLLTWPKLDAAARMVLDRSSELNGNQYELLVDVAREISEESPLASTLALRAMIDFALENGRSKRYPYIAKHLIECEKLSHRIDDFRNHGDHQIYVARLKERHGRKTEFWNA